MPWGRFRGRIAADCVEGGPGMRERPIVSAVVGFVLAAVTAVVLVVTPDAGALQMLQGQNGALAATPNDPSFGQQWGLHNTGQVVNGAKGTAGADINAPAAWGVASDSRSVVVAELDSGVDYQHPDLAANIWSNPGGVGGCAAGTHGFNVVANTCDPLDDFGHGTQVAGVLGAVGNNGAGIAGVAWRTTILPVKWTDSAWRASPTSAPPPSTGPRPATTSSPPTWAAATSSTRAARSPRRWCRARPPWSCRSRTCRPA